MREKSENRTKSLLNKSQAFIFPIFVLSERMKFRMYYIFCLDVNFDSSELFSVLVIPPYQKKFRKISQTCNISNWNQLLQNPPQQFEIWFSYKISIEAHKKALRWDSIFQKHLLAPKSHIVGNRKTTYFIPHLHCVFNRIFPLKHFFLNFKKFKKKFIQYTTTHPTRQSCVKFTL